MAAFLFDRVAQVEKQSVERDRSYYLQLMRECLETVREGKTAAEPAG